MTRRVDWVVFDVGGTLVDETRMWRTWAQRIGVSEARFLKELDDVLAARLHHREVFARLAPGLDIAAAERAAPFHITRGDFFDDALPALEALAARGFQVAVAANQPEVTETVLPANAAGMLSVFLPRGPWGRVHATRPHAAQAALSVEHLTDLAGLLGGD